MPGITVKPAVPDGGNAAARLLPTLADFDAGWRIARPAAGDSAGAVDLGLERFLTGRLPERDVVALADSPVFLRAPAQLAYATAAVLSGRRAGAEAFALLASEEFARAFAEGVIAGAVVDPGTVELLGSITGPVELSGVMVPGAEGAAHRTTFAGASGERMVPVHVDVAVLHSGPGLVMAWTADAPDPFPDADRDHLVARLAGRLVCAMGEPPPLA